MFMESALFMYWDGIKLGNLNQKINKYVYILCFDCHHWGNLKCRKETEIILQQCSAPFRKVAHRIGPECSGPPMIWWPLAAGLQCGMGLGWPRGDYQWSGDSCNVEWVLDGSEVTINDLVMAATWNGSWMWLRGDYQWSGDSCNVEWVLDGSEVTINDLATAAMWSGSWMAQRWLPMIWRQLQCGMGLGWLRGDYQWSGDSCNVEWVLDGSEVTTNDLATAAMWNGSWMAQRWLPMIWRQLQCGMGLGWLRGDYQWSGDSCNVEWVLDGSEVPTNDLAAGL